MAHFHIGISISDAVPAVPVPNLVTNSEDLDGGWVVFATAAVTGVAVSLPAIDDYIEQYVTTSFITGEVYTLSADFRGTAGETVTLYAGDKFTPAGKEVVLTTDWARHSLTTTTHDGGGEQNISVWRETGRTATSLDVRNVQFNKGTNLAYYP